MSYAWNRRYPEDIEEILKNFKQSQTQEQEDREPDPDRFKEQKEKKGKGPKIRNRQEKIGTLQERCPVCHAMLERVKDGVVPKTGFMLLQFGANQDNTGYESYYCHHCKNFILNVITKNVVTISPSFSIGAPGAAPPPGA